MCDVIRSATLGVVSVVELLSDVHDALELEIRMCEAEESLEPGGGDLIW